MKKRVLCIEDHTDTNKLISVILEDYEVISADSLEDARRKAAAEKFDLYLVDYYLPDGLGLEFILEVKSLNGETPILFVTGSPIDESQAERLGAVGIVQKGDEAFVENLRNQVTQLFASTDSK
jgi:DNA-binding response OmpR family regulator